MNDTQETLAPDGKGEAAGAGSALEVLHWLHSEGIAMVGVSDVQRRFRLGYVPALRLLDELTNSAKITGPMADARGKRVVWPNTERTNEGPDA